MAEAVGFNNSFSGNICYSSNDLNSNLKKLIFNNLTWGNSLSHARTKEKTSIHSR